MNEKLNQLLENFTALNREFSQLIEAGNLARHTHSATSLEVARQHPIVCEELQMSLSPVIYFHLN